MSPRQDPHDVLGVQRGASKDEIRTAYRRLARELHPDVKRGSYSDEMAVLNDAYQALTSSASRQTSTTSKGSEEAKSQNSEFSSVTSPARAVAFPWRGIIATSVVGAVAIFGLSLFAGPDSESPPDGVIQSGSCVQINDSLLAVEVSCLTEQHQVVTQLVPLDARCADGSTGFLDRLGMGRVCLE
jgi:molecular chaperone DnaJ